MAENNQSYSDLQIIKRRFFAMRNGIIADSLRKSGSGFKIIFGLNIPQLKEIAESLGPSVELATKLWSNTSTRESMLLATMIYPAELLNEADARNWLESIDDCEVADVFCHNLLKGQPFVNCLASQLCASDRPIKRYMGLRLYLRIYTESPLEIKKIAEEELLRPRSVATPVAKMLLDELEYYLENNRAVP